MLGLSVIILFKSLLHVFCSLVFSAHNSSVKEVMKESFIFLEARWIFFYLLKGFWDQWVGLLCETAPRLVCFKCCRAEATKSLNQNIKSRAFIPKGFQSIGIKAKQKSLILRIGTRRNSNSKLRKFQSLSLHKFAFPLKETFSMFPAQYTIQEGG